MTRLGASPFSMWRDIAYTNTEAVQAALLALEQGLAHLRENLRTPELRDEFERPTDSGGSNEQHATSGHFVSENRLYKQWFPRASPAAYVARAQPVYESFSTGIGIDILGGKVQDQLGGKV